MILQAENIKNDAGVVAERLAPKIDTHVPGAMAAGAAPAGA